VTGHRVVSVIGARPEIIQATPLSSALEGRIEEVLVHTGQHYSASLSGDQILDTRLRTPDRFLGIGEQRGADPVVLGMQRLLGVVDEVGPQAVLVRGDTHATLSGALAAAARRLPLIHVEAGLRSHRAEMPEERNRIIADHLSDLLLAPTPTTVDNLAAERVRGRVAETGDVLADMLELCRDRIPDPGVDGEFALATVHRNYNTDSRERLAAVLACLAACDLRVIFPLHPRTRVRLEAWDLRLPGNVEVVGPVPYTRMLALERAAQVILTDSGGVQREAYLWGVPCITLREETEWVETVSTGWNALVGVDPARAAAAMRAPRPAEHPVVFGDGHAASHIAELVAGLVSEHTVPRR